MTATHVQCTLYRARTKTMLRPLRPKRLSQEPHTHTPHSTCSDIPSVSVSPQGLELGIARKCLTQPEGQNLIRTDRHKLQQEADHAQKFAAHSHVLVPLWRQTCQCSREHYNAGSELPVGPGGACALTAAE